MTTDGPVVENAVLTESLPLDLPEVGIEIGPGERLRRLRRRRRLVREEMLAVLVLLVVLAITVAVLANQWLSSGTSSNALFHLFSGGTT
jgi:hypothetical protein